MTKNFYDSILSIINHNDTVKKTVSDFDDISKYLKVKFPSVSIDETPIFICDNNILLKTCLEYANGAYIPSLGLIIIKKVPNVSGSIDGHFSLVLNSKIANPIEVSHIVVHELLHCISHKLNLPSRKHVSMEEEFVFKNSIEYYRSVGLSDDDILNTILIAFCINEILSDAKSMLDLFRIVKFCKKLKHIPEYVIDTKTAYHPLPCPKSEYLRFLDEHATMLSDLIIEESQGRGRIMLDSYNNESKAMKHTCSRVNRFLSFED